MREPMDQERAGASPVITASTLSSSGEPTTASFLNNASSSVTGMVQHTDSTVVRSVTVIAVAKVLAAHSEFPDFEKDIRALCR